MAPLKIVTSRLHLPARSLSIQHFLDDIAAQDSDYLTCFSRIAPILTLFYFAESKLQPDQYYTVVEAEWILYATSIHSRRGVFLLEYREA